MSGFVAYSGPRPVPEPSPPGSILRPFRLRIFFALWVAALVSNIGTWMQNVGAAWLMTALTPSPLMVALIQTASSLPILLLALPAGALADIVDRRRLLIFSQAWMLAAAGALGYLTLTHAASPWILLALSFALGIGSAINAPAWQAIIPELVGREDLTAAISLNGINYNVARAIGPAIGGLVVAAAGVGPTFLLNALSFLGVMAVLYEWRRVARPAVLPAERVMGAIRAGARYVRYDSKLRAVLIQTAAFIFGASTLWAVLPSVARWSLGLGAAGYGMLLGFFGGGAVLGGMLMPRIGRRFSRDTVVFATAIIVASTTAVLAPWHNLVLDCTVLTVGGAAWTIAMSTLNVAAQLSVPGWVQGRALATYQMIVQGGMAIGGVLWGYVAERVGLPAALLGGAAATMLAILMRYWFPLATDADLDLETVPRPEPEIAHAIDPDSGPVLVTVEYLIDPERAVEFERASRALREIRRRDGATFWGMFFDAAAPGRFVEYFAVESWLEHLRQHQRVTAADLLILNHIFAFHVGAHPPAVTHQVSAQSLDGANAEFFAQLATSGVRDPDAR
ncbi:MAG: MFS transporter [Candidatus Binataceae bacterium]